MAFADPTKELALIKRIASGLIVLTNHLRYYDERNDVVRLSTSRLFHLLDRYFVEEAVLEVGITRNGLLFRGEFLERYT